MVKNRRKIKVLVSDPLADEGISILKEAGLVVDQVSNCPENELARRIKGYEGLIVRSGTRVTKKTINASDKLRVIGRAGVGLDNVDVGAASRKGIIVMNAPSANTISTAEHAFGLMMALSRNIPQANISVKAGVWDRKRFMGPKVRGKILGVVGMGRIGSEVAGRALSFGMRVIAFDPFLSEEKARKMNTEPVSMNRLLSESDFITIHTPLTPETRGLIGEKAFGKMKKGVRIINAARGGIIDEKALARYIRSGKVAGAALDVFESDAKPPVDSPVIGNEKVIVTPHLGSATEEAQVGVAVDTAKAVADALTGKGLRNAVNVPVLEGEALKTIRPYISLAERIGAIQSQLIEDTIEGITISYSGDIAGSDVEPVTRALLKGFFAPVMGGDVNYVNSALIAEERGIKVLEKKTRQITDFANLIGVEFVSGKKKKVIMGTLFSNNEPRIIRIDKFHVEAIPEGYMLLVSNDDVPGVVGKIGTILGKNGINIAEMSFGRDKRTGQAISLLNIDSKAPEEVIKKLKKTSNIKGVKQVYVAV